jgi:hypothetical protein
VGTHQDFSFILSSSQQDIKEGNPMRAVKLLHSLFDKSCGFIDKRLRNTLFSAAETLVFCKQLSIASIGRCLQRQAKVKHKIKCIDRLFGNQALHSRRRDIYGILSRLLVNGNNMPLIIVDWSGLTPCGTYHFLSATLALNGRSLTLYEEVHPLKNYLKRKIHRRFLKTLYSLLPAGCHPIIVTDAGFQNPWFSLVRGMGWDFIGRVRHKTYCCEEGTEHWFAVKTFYEKATLKARYLGKLLLVKTSPMLCHFYLMKQRNKNRIKKNLAGKKVQCSSSKKHAKREKEPWLIVSSLPVDTWGAVKIMLLYKKRMQIEETFRDIKNMRNGLGLRHCRSFTVERLNVALLIAALAMIVVWLFGIAAKQKNLHYLFQSNTEKRRNVLSVFTIGWQILIEDEIQFRKKELMKALIFIVSSAIRSEAC